MPNTLIGAFYQSAELTGTGSAQIVRHNMRGIPQMAYVIPTVIGANVAYSAVIGARTAGTVTVTVPANVKYRLVAHR